MRALTCGFCSCVDPRLARVFEMHAAAALFGELNSSRAAARKRAIACIASLSASLPEKMLESQLTTPIFEHM